MLVIVAPVYRGGLIPPTIAARRGAFLGWVGVAVVPGVLLSQALAGQRRVGIRVGRLSAIRLRQHHR